MHLIECYALTAGCLIDRCSIETDPIELPQKKYITLHSYNPKGEIRQYYYWQNVIDDLLSNNNFNFEIVQIGGSNDTKLDNINISYLGKTNVHTLAYLIQNCELHVGFDSFPVHLASHFDKKIVAIYAQYMNNTGPYFSTSGKCILIQPDFSLHRPFYSNGYDPFKTINKIPPNAISSSILNILGIT